MSDVRQWFKRWIGAKDKAIDVEVKFSALGTIADKFRDLSRICVNVPRSKVKEIEVSTIYQIESMQDEIESTVRRLECLTSDTQIVSDGLVGDDNECLCEVNEKGFIVKFSKSCPWAGHPERADRDEKKRLTSDTPPIGKSAAELEDELFSNKGMDDCLTSDTSAPIDLETTESQPSAEAIASRGSRP